MAQPQGQFSPFDLIAAGNPQAAAINLAGRSGYGGGKGLQFLGNVLAGLSQVRSGGLIGAGSTIVDRMNNQKYLDQVQEMAKAKAMQEYWADIEKKEQEYWGREDNKGIAQTQGVNIPDFRGTRALTAQEVDATKYNNSIGALNKLLQGEALQIPEGGQIDPALIRDYFKQQSDVAQARDFSQTQLRQQFLPKPGIYAQPNAKPQGNTPMLENPLAGLQGAVSQAQVQDPITQRSPFLQYSLPPVDQMRPIEERRQQDALNETIRSNKADEAIGWYNAKHKGGGGGSSNPYTILNGAQNYAQGQLKALEAQMNQQGFLDDKGVAKRPNLDTGAWLFDWDGDPAKIQASKNKQALFDAYEKRRQDLYSAISGASPTFGGNSQQKLNNAGVKATTPKGKSSAIPGLRFE